MPVGIVDVPDCAGDVVPSRLVEETDGDALEDVDEGVEEAEVEGYEPGRQDEIVDAPDWPKSVVSACLGLLRMFPTSGSSSLGRESASATTLALPCM